jgi:hypothetical protein
MGRKTLICVRRGTQSKLEGCRLEVGELGFTTDTHKLFIGSDHGNLLLAAGKSASCNDLEQTEKSE